MITLEILSIATINYFTSSPEIFRPSSVQINQVRNLLNTMHQNLHSVIEIILQRLPESMQNSQPSQKLNAVVK
jgi:archaellum biogenesis protein FlaJ (TadC family)